MPDDPIEGLAARAPPRRGEDDAARLARLRCEHEEARAATALARLRRRQAEHVAATAWATTTARVFATIRWQLEDRLTALVTEVRAAGDVRRDTIAARGWLRDVRSGIVAHANTTPPPT